MSTDSENEAETEEIQEIMNNHGLDADEAQHVAEIMDEYGLDEDDAVELNDVL